MDDHSPHPDAPTASLWSRMLGVLVAPRATFVRLAANPRSLDVLTMVSAVTALCTWALLSTEAGRLGLLDQRVATLESFGFIVTDEMYSELQRASDSSGALWAGLWLAGVPLASLTAAALFFFVLSVLLGGGASLRQVLAVVAHSNTVVLVRQLCVTPLNYVRESAGNPANLAVFFPMLDEGSFLARLLGTMDLFIVWWMGVLAVGCGVLYRRRAAPIALWLFGGYVAFGMVLATITTILSVE